MPYPSIRLEHLFVGATVTVYARQLRVVDFADEFTRRSLGGSRQRRARARAYARSRTAAHEHADPARCV